VRHRYIHLANAALFLIAFFSFIRVPLAHAAQLSYVSDTINDSRPSLSINHTIVFRTTSDIPASGRIVIAFESSSFSIDPQFSYNDAEISVSTNSSFSDGVDRPLAAMPDGANDGLAVASGTGPITITLSSAAGIPAGSYIRILLGTNASGGTYQIANPSSVGSYRILLNTYNASGGSIDYGAAMVAILPAVGVDANTNGSMPVLSNGLPSGTVPSNAGTILVSFNTSAYATCRYATSSGVSYDAMTNTTVDYSLGLFHTFLIGNIVKGNTYIFYARCSDFAGIEDISDYVISFYAGNPTGTGTGGGQSGGSGGGGGGGGGGGESYPPAPGTPSLLLSGVAMPEANIAVLQDGSLISASAVAGGNGDFSLAIPPLPQGTYSFTVEALGAGSTVLSSYTVTITLVAGTTNNITDIVWPPSIDFVTSTVALGKPFLIAGLGAPSSTIDIFVVNQANTMSPFSATTTVDANGVWSYPLSTTGFPMGTYQIKIRESVSSLAMSNFSSIALLGVGSLPKGNLNMGDLNGDGKINLADFSILLYHWDTNYPPAEFDGGSKVDLPDLSILLAHWTG
jgi:hypothetical protein